jgi:hypothetical protein
MKTILGIFVAVLWLLLPLLSVAQNQRSDDGQRHDQGYGNSHGRWEGRLSAEDQGRFDSYYSRWLDAKRNKNHDEMASMENRMRDVMGHYNIPSDVPFGQIASNNNQGYGAYRRGDGDDDNDAQSQRGHHYGQLRHRQAQWQGRLSAEEQARFDSYYSRWLDYRRTNNRDEIASMENRMRDVMAHNSIPSNTAFSQIASPSAGGNSRPNIPRFSGDDERRFRSYYSRWQEASRTNNRDEIAGMEGRMRDVMNQHNIPNDVSYDEVMNMLNGYNQN